jgi:hypothetical protein
MLEARCACRLQCRNRGCIWTSAPASPKQPRMPLRLRSERLSKRLIHVPHAARLRFDPLSATPGSFQLQHLQLKKVSARFARKRMRQKLAVHHPLHARKGGSMARCSQERQCHTMWDEYCKIFEARSELVSYADWIELVERPELPYAVSNRNATSPEWTWHAVVVHRRCRPITPTKRCCAPAWTVCWLRVIRAWELCIADDASTKGHAVRATLEEYAAREQAHQADYLRVQNGHIVAASNSALELAGRRIRRPARP